MIDVITPRSSHHLFVVVDVVVEPTNLVFKLLFEFKIAALISIRRITTNSLTNNNDNTMR